MQPAGAQQHLLLPGAEQEPKVSVPLLSRAAQFRFPFFIIIIFFIMGLIFLLFSQLWFNIQLNFRSNFLHGLDFRLQIVYY